jgi:hypothetical protein
MNRNPWQTLRIGSALVVIFASGVMVGRVMPSRAPEAKATNASSTVFPARISVTRNDADTLVANLAVQLGLTPEQKAQMRQIAVEWAAEARNATRRSKVRHELFERYVPKFRSVLNAQQAEAYDRLLENHPFRTSPAPAE